jgi:hypothetical protein
MPTNKKTKEHAGDIAPQEFSMDEKAAETPLAPNEIAEQKESVKEQATHHALRQEIENMELDDQAKLQVQSHANDLQSLQHNEKIKNLLQIAKTKGVIFAVNVAKKMNDPYLLDVFHDMLAKEGYYKEFFK